MGLTLSPLFRFSGSQHCGHIHCAYQYREHYHCLDPECNYQVWPHAGRGGGGSSTSRLGFTWVGREHRPAICIPRLLSPLVNCLSRPFKGWTYCFIFKMKR